MIPKVQGAVVIPHPADWAKPVREVRKFSTKLVHGLTGGEDRAACIDGSRIEQEYTITTTDATQTASLNIQLAEAMRCGRAIVPRVGRPQRIDNTDTDLTSATEGVGYADYEIEVGKRYYYTRGMADTELSQDGTVWQQVEHMSLTDIDITAPPDTIGGVPVVVGDDVLLVGQYVTTENGVYTYTSLTPPTIIRAGYADTGAEIKQLVVEVYSTLYVNMNRTEPVLGTDPIHFERTDKTLDRSGHFVGAQAEVRLSYSTRDARGTIRQANRDETTCDGEWVWQEGELVMLVNPRGYGENRTWLMNAGATADSGEWKADTETAGTVETYGGAIDQSMILGSPDVPAYVFKTQRTDAGADPAALAFDYTISKLKPGCGCRVRLLFSENDTNLCRVTGARRMNVTVRGATTSTVRDFEPWREAGEEAAKAVCLDFVVEPTSSGTVTVEIRPHYSTWLGHVASSGDSVIRVDVKDDTGIDLLNVPNPLVVDGVTLGPGAWVLLAGQMDQSENGVYIMEGALPGEPLVFRRYPAEFGGDEAAFYEWHIAHIQEGTVYAGQYWYTSNPGFIIGGNVVYSQTLEPYAISLAGIEFYQWTYEVRQLKQGSTSGYLTWDVWARGLYSDSIAYPVLIGRPEVSSYNAVTDWYVAAHLLVTEDATQEDPGPVHECSTEVCDLPYTPQDDPPDEWPVLDPDMTGWNSHISAYNWGVTNPNESLTKAQVDFSKELLQREIQLAVGWGSIPSDAVFGVWCWFYDPGGVHYAAANKFNANDPEPRFGDPIEDRYNRQWFGVSWALGILWKEATP